MHRMIKEHCDAKQIVDIHLVALEEKVVMENIDNALRSTPVPLPRSALWQGF